MTTENPAQIRKQDPEKTWVECGQCDDGMSDHDCGEDSCACLYPEPNVRCDTCNGKGGWYIDDYFGDFITQDDLSQIMMKRERKKSLIGAKAR